MNLRIVWNNDLKKEINFSPLDHVNIFLQIYEIIKNYNTKKKIKKV
jgi:hypothetical protein